MPYAPIRDILTYYEEAGSGDPLVLIMGLGGDLQAWALQVPALARQFRVITFDNRGAGRTSAPDKPYSIDGMADDLAALLDSLKIDKANLLGFSMGGFIAQEFALKYPKRVEKLILLASACSIDGYTANVVRSWVDVRRSSMSREQTVRLTASWLYSPELLDDQASLMKRAEELVRVVASHAPLTLQATKEAVLRLRPTVPHGEGNDLVLMCYMSRDFKEGMEAFLNKRKPVWQGK